MARAKKEKLPQIVVTEDKEGKIRVNVEACYSKEHALFMLGQAIVTITLPQEGESEEETEEK